MYIYSGLAGKEFKISAHLSSGAMDHSFGLSHHLLLHFANTSSENSDETSTDSRLKH